MFFIRFWISNLNGEHQAVGHAISHLIYVGRIVPRQLISTLRIQDGMAQSIKQIAAPPDVVIYGCVSAVTMIMRLVKMCKFGRWT